MGKNDEHSGRNCLVEIEETSPQKRTKMTTAQQPMDPITFTCILNELAKRESEKNQSSNLEIMSDISQKIYELYEGSYENYTLIELIKILRQSNNEDKCPWNKKAIIELIERENMDVPRKFKLEPTKWEHYRIRRSLDVLQTPLFDIYEGCIIELEDGSRWDIDVVEDQILKSEDLPRDDYESWEDIVYVYLEGAEGEEIQMTADEFIHMLDHDDVTLLQIRDLCYFMSEEEEEYWNNCIRII